MKIDLQDLERRARSRMAAPLDPREILARSLVAYPDDPAVTVALIERIRELESALVESIYDMQIATAQTWRELLEKGVVLQ